MVIRIDEHETTSDFRIFILSFHGAIITVTVTASAAVVDDWIHMTRSLHRRFAGRFVVGFDVAGFRRAETLNLCVRHRCLIFQLSQAHQVPNSLRNFLMDSGNLFVGFWSGLDRWSLLNSRHRMRMFREPLDLRFLSRTFIDDQDLHMASTEEIVRYGLGIFGVRFPQEITMSDNWGVQHLGIEQVQVAALEVYIAYSCGMAKRVWTISWDHLNFLHLHLSSLFGPPS